MVFEAAHVLAGVVLEREDVHAAVLTGRMRREEMETGRDGLRPPAGERVGNDRPP